MVEIGSKLFKLTINLCLYKVLCVCVGLLNSVCPHTVGDGGGQTFLVHSRGDKLLPQTEGGQTFSTNGGGTNIFTDQGRGKSIYCLGW